MGLLAKYLLAQGAVHEAIMPGLVNVGAQEPNGKGLAQDNALPAPLTQVPPV